MSLGKDTRRRKCGDYVVGGEPVMGDKIGVQGDGLLLACQSEAGTRGLHGKWEHAYKCM